MQVSGGKCRKKEEGMEERRTHLKRMVPVA